MNVPAREIIRAELARRGIIPFSRFMELALYAPGAGYYETQERVGRAGDFYTSVSAGPLFGELIARQLAEWLRPGDVILEAGANNGQLARDLLTAPCIRGNFTYIIIEPSERQRARQQEALRGLGVEWIPSLAETGGFRGALISNELLDALPVNVWRWRRDQHAWVQLGVIEASGQFAWAPLPGSAAPSLPWITLPDELADLLPDNFTVEEHAAGAQWWSLAAQQLREGYLLAFDYGLEAEEFFKPERASGTVRAYARHRLLSDVLACPGDQDITAHVNFTAIRRAGESAGLRTLFDGRQSAFLHGAAEKWMRREPQDWTPARARQFQILTHPEHLGRGFRALAQAR